MPPHFVCLKERGCQINILCLGRKLSDKKKIFPQAKNNCLLFTCHDDSGDNGFVQRLHLDQSVYNKHRFKQLKKLLYFHLRSDRIVPWVSK